MSARAERRAIVALLTVFALLVQALIPSLALAASPARGDMLICTERGLEGAPAGAIPDQPSADHVCQHCICPGIASTPTPHATVQTVSYIVRETPVAATPRGVRPQARAPPRPPGQGPPVSSV
jgi:hypothetical protein